MTIKDANNCTSTSALTNVINIAGATVSATSANASCGVNNGSITATGIGGGAPYQFSLNGVSFQSGNLFSGLAPGTYTVTIKDANNCTSVSSPLSITMINGATVSALATNSNCGFNNGSIAASGTGGTLPYQYSINGINFQANNVFNGLAAASYIVTIKDANNCTATSSAVTINQNASLTISVAGNPIICEGESTTITATASGGIAPYHFSWNNGVLLSSQNFNPTVSTNYFVVAYDASNCATSPQQISVVVNPKPPIAFSINPIDGCVPLKVQFAPNSIINSSVYSWNYGDFTIGNGALTSHTYLQSGSYSVQLKVTSDKGCSDSLLKTNAVNVYPQPHALFTANPWTGTLENPRIEFQDLTSGAQDWWWDFGESGGTSSAQNPVYTYADTGHYKVSMIIMDAHNCMDTAVGEIIIDGEFTYYIPNSFSPNNDGINDYFAGMGVGIKFTELYIFDRWGKQFFYEKGLYPKWDGRNQFDNTLVQEDVYVYRINVLDIFGKTHEFEGIVTLIR